MLIYDTDNVHSVYNDLCEEVTYSRNRAYNNLWI